MRADALVNIPSAAGADLGACRTTAAAQTKSDTFAAFVHEQR